MVGLGLWVTNFQFISDAVFVATKFVLLVEEDKYHCTYNPSIDAKMWTPSDGKGRKKGNGGESKKEGGSSASSGYGKGCTKKSKAAEKGGDDCANEGRKSKKAISKTKNEKGKGDNIFEHNHSLHYSPQTTPTVFAQTKQPSPTSSPPPTSSPTLEATPSPMSVAPNPFFSEPTPAPLHAVGPSNTPSSSPIPTEKMCPEILESGCSVCGEDLCVSNPGAIFSFPGQPDASCSTLEEAGLQGQIPSTQCIALPPIIGTLCGCLSNEPQPPAISPAPSETLFVPPTEMPNTLPPSETAAPTRPFNFCHVCGEGLILANPGATVSIPGEEDTTCLVIANLGMRGSFDAARCDESVPLVEQACGCVPRHPVCRVCGVGSTIIDPDEVVIFPDQPPSRCDQLVLAGFLGLIPSAQCVSTIPIITEFCGCQEIEPQLCNIYGEGYELINLNATVTFPVGGKVFCAYLDQGIVIIDPALCPFIAKIAYEFCGRRQSSNYPACNICGEGSRIVDPEATIGISGQQTPSCGELEVDGIEGLISPDVCQAIGSSVETACGCEPDECQPFAPCEVCGEDKVIIDPDATLVFPSGQQVLSCAQFAELGSGCGLDPAICRNAVETVDTICGCQELTAVASPTTNPAPAGLSPTSSPNEVAGPTSCLADDDGNFGNTDIGTEVSIVYLYQVEMLRNTVMPWSSLQTIDGIVIQLERLVSNAMIPALFPRQCGLSTGRRLQREIVGLSAAQRDLIVDGTF